jgi:hypothetical protein
VIQVNFRLFGVSVQEGEASGLQAPRLEVSIKGLKRYLSPLEYASLLGFEV